MGGHTPTLLGGLVLKSRDGLGFKSLLNSSPCVSGKALVESTLLPKWDKGSFLEMHILGPRLTSFPLWGGGVAAS